MWQRRHLGHGTVVMSISNTVRVDERVRNFDGFGEIKYVDRF